MEVSANPPAREASAAEPSAAASTRAPWALLGILAGTTVLALSLWFSASVVAPTLIRL
jgi:hypothetical protein